MKYNDFSKNLIQEKYDKSEYSALCGTIFADFT